MKPVSHPAATSLNEGGSIAVAVYSALSDLPPDVLAFVSDHSRDQLCLSEVWFDLLINYSPFVGQQPRIYVVKSEDGTVDCVLFAAASTATQPARVRRLASLTNFYTMSFAPIVRRPNENAAKAIATLATAITRERPAWDVVELRSLVQETSSTTDLIAALRRAGMLVDTFLQFENWYQPVRDMSSAQYFSSRPSQLRHTVDRKSRKASKQYCMGVRIYRTPADLEKGLSDYQAVYARSWKQPEAYPEFVPQLLRRSAEQGTLRLGVLYLDTMPAAAQIWLVTGSRATIYKLAYDQTFAKLSVGSILSKAMFDHVIDVDRVAEVDYGVGNEPYKHDWMSDCRHLVGLIGFNLHSVGGLREAARHFGGVTVRRMLNKLGFGSSEHQFPPQSSD